MNKFKSFYESEQVSEYLYDYGFGYFEIDRDDFESFVRNINQMGNKRYIRRFNFICKVGSGYKYEITGSNKQKGSLYIFDFNDKISKDLGSGGKIAVHGKYSFEIALELGMFETTFMGFGHKKLISSVDNFKWIDISPQDLEVENL
jgi:hypothetical protein